MPQIFTQIGQVVRFIDEELQQQYEAIYKAPFTIHSSELQGDAKLSQEHWDECIKLKDADGKIFPEAPEEFLDAYDLTKESKAPLPKSNQSGEVDDYAVPLRDSNG